MKFVVTRASDWGLEGKDILERVGVPEEFNPKIEIMPETGRYRRMEIVTIEVESLEKLMEFCKAVKHDVMIDYEDSLYRNMPSLLIYDDYIE